MMATTLVFIILIESSLSINIKELISENSAIQFYLGDFEEDLYHEIVSEHAVSVMDIHIPPENNIPIFVFDTNADFLSNVSYDHQQIWFINEDNIKYIGSWKLRLDSMVFLWTEIQEKLFIKVSKTSVFVMLS